jgi:type IV secretory pathway TrbL component
LASSFGPTAAAAAAAAAAAGAATATASALRREAVAGRATSSNNCKGDERESVVAKTERKIEKKKT